jgi:hypothetical protein
MSSTARTQDRNSDDYYVTPHWVIESFLNATNPCNPDCKRPLALGCKILDPSAGGCEQYEMSYPKVLGQFGHKHVDTWDIRPDSKAQYREIDFLQTKGEGRYDTVITNPPFKFAEQFVYKALEHVNNNGLVIMLQRLNWLGSLKRFEMWSSLPLNSVFVHHKRPGFNPKKPSATDSIEYAHFVFYKNQHRKTPAQLFVI